MIAARRKRRADPLRDAEARTDATVARSLPIVRRLLLGDPKAGGELRALLARQYVIGALLGAAYEARRLRRDGVPIAKPEGQRVTEDDLTGQVAFDIAANLNIARLPYVMAINVFADDIPDLAETVRQLEIRAAGMSARVVQRTESDAAEIIRRIVAKAEGGKVGTLGGLGVRPEAAARAINTSLGNEAIRGRLDTETRTALMDAFNKGGRSVVVRHATDIPVMVLSEVRDRRTRGNPRGLYPDAGPHYQMDGFTAATTDPVWERITPPNGWNCRATTRGMSIGEADRKGLLLDDGSVDVVLLRDRHARQWALIERGVYPDPGF